MPPHWVPVVLQGDLAVEQQWGWRGWLPAPEAALNNAELEFWLSERTGVDSARLPSLVGNTTRLESVRLLRVPQQLWLILCSGAMLLLGLGLRFAPLPPAVHWASIVALGGALLALGIFWASLLPALLYGCLPGVAVLAAVVVLRWLMQQRYRRQLVFLPGFTRAKAGSSLRRPSSVTRSREPSTVDVPMAASSTSASNSAASSAHGS
jgi:hypothetical protein